MGSGVGHLDRHDYYGLSIRSHWPLPYPAGPHGNYEQVELYEGSPALFASAAANAAHCLAPTMAFRHARLQDGTDYLQWSGLFEFVISTDGQRIAGRCSRKTAIESFHTHLLGQVISFALLKKRIEPLHATVVVFDGAAVAFLGDSGYGKSSLAAACLHAGARLLTDDLLVIKYMGERWLAFPGPPRIKLFRESAEMYLGARAVGVHLYGPTSKLVIPIRSDQAVQAPIPLKRIFRLRRPTERATSNRVTIRRRSRRQAFLDLITNTYNAAIRNPDRLSSQFRFASQLAASIPVKSLVFPRRLERLPDVVEAIVADLAR